MPTDPEQFVESLDPDEQVIVRALRAVVRRLVPDAVESVVWGCLSYHRPLLGGRVKGAVCQIVPRNGGIRLDFIHGIRLSDPHRLLQGSRVSKRYVPIPSAEYAMRPDIVALVHEAAYPAVAPAAMEHQS